MQPDEGIGLEPVATDPVATVDECDARVGVVDQRIGERHAAGPGADHEVVGLDFPRHGATKAQACACEHPAAWSNRAGPITAKSCVLPKIGHIRVHTVDIFDTAVFPGGPVTHTEEALKETGGATLLAVEQTEQVETPRRRDRRRRASSGRVVERRGREAEEASPALTEPIVVWRAPRSPPLACSRWRPSPPTSSSPTHRRRPTRLVADAQAEADALRAASREDADRAAGELSRLRDEQTADLDRERTAALSGLAEQKATLEAQVEALREQENDYRSQLRRQLTEHLALLGDAGTGTPASVAS